MCAEPVYPLTFPTNVGFTTSEWKIIRTVAVTESPFTYSQTAHQFTGAKWQTTVQLPPMKREVAVEYQAFFMQLHGRFGTFLLGDPDAKTIRGAESASPTVNGSHAVGAYDIAIKGASASATVFKKGDYVQFGTGATSKLHILIADCTSNSSGNATMNIEPPLKSALSNDATITYTNAKAVMRMDANDLGWNANKVSNYGFAFSCTEVL